MRRGRGEVRLGVCSSDHQHTSIFAIQTYPAPVLWTERKLRGGGGVGGWGVGVGWGGGGGGGLMDDKQPTV